MRQGDKPCKSKQVLGEPYKICYKVENRDEEPLEQRDQGSSKTTPLKLPLDQENHRLLNC